MLIEGAVRLSYESKDLKEDLESIVSNFNFLYAIAKNYGTQIL